MTTSDLDLATAAAAGDAAAFSSLLERHYDSLFRLAFRLTGSKAEAEDLTQDVCLALPTKLKNFSGQAKVSTWLYRVMVNAAHDRRRKQSRSAKLAKGWGDWEKNRASANAETAAQIDWLHQAMTILSPDLRDTLALVLDDVTHKDAADILGVSEGTVSWRISKAKRTLREAHAKEDRI
ncbi:RNA polymerase sigma factor [Yoonia litorea]|nr:RNA polymerase sigma factor [Yoonia litorea]